MNSLKLVNGILLEEIEEGLLVRQGPEAYVARDWCLSPPVIELVEGAAAAGLNWMIRNNHPRHNARWPNKRGVVYLAFSPTENQQWSLAIDSIRPKAADFGHGVFNGKYHEQFVSRELPFTFEKRNKGAGHLVVTREHVFLRSQPCPALTMKSLTLAGSSKSTQGLQQNTESKERS